MSKSLAAISALIGTIIGAGILGIPYVVMRSGFAIGLVHLIVIAAIMIITMLYLGEIALRTKTNHHLTGYAELYLGGKGKILMFIASLIGIYSAVLAYLIGEGESLSHLFFSSADYTLPFGIAFWLALSALSYFGLKALEDGEEVGVVLIFILIISVSVMALNKIDPANLAYLNPENFFVPFGVILFAFLGFSSLPEVKRILQNKEKYMKRSIITANLIVLVIYAVFALVVLGFKGAATPQIATLALGKPFILLGIITILTSYLALSIALIDTLCFDFHLSKNKSWLITTLPPLALFVILEIFNLTNFIKVIGIGGVLSGGLTAILILFMTKRAKKFGRRKPEYQLPYSEIFTWILIAIFTIGAILEIMSII